MAKKPEGIARSYSAQFTTQWNDVQRLASNSNVTWTHNPFSTAVYLFVLLIFHIFFSVNFDAYLHNNKPIIELNSLTFTGMFALGQNTASDGNRIWWGDAWNLTAVGHGVVSWVLMHWIKGSANFYDQNELCGMTWFEQLSASPTYPASYYSPRFLISVPTILTYIACHMSNYDLRTVGLNMVILFVLVLSKQDFMYGVRVLGINRTVGVDDGSKQISREGSEVSFQGKVKGN
mmetsp:Transcript_12844/g.26220  ORF Transcript_12844/g.26220 Transcript_12844/m.26220 type:complete len:233 (-) Transcript_12844:55-753(-)|eukprot:CAMPEP_0118654648 /NCGR_PEP_ID=MMETSP0785-20121206/12505_1 /TAXON_ID=91992 /ORGANISM="Bolidomonas pacifica, Strain CCMP 1866" /LENGTH=232 /DNA_ID=CAMNT_0006547329 /DNA_START=27 /DNA_END=725 /DNA_ORIENTATION=-